MLKKKNPKKQKKSCDDLNIADFTSKQMKRYKK